MGIVLDFGYDIMVSFPGFKGCITVNFTEVTCAIICLYLLRHFIHITDYYLANMSSYFISYTGVCKNRIYNVVILYRPKACRGLSIKGVYKVYHLLLPHATCPSSSQFVMHACQSIRNQMCLVLQLVDKHMETAKQSMQDLSSR